MAGTIAFALKKISLSVLLMSLPMSPSIISTHDFISEMGTDKASRFSDAQNLSMMVMAKNVKSYIGTPVMQNMELSPWQVIQLTAKTAVIFVPLCCAGEYDDYQNFNAYFKWQKPEQE